MNDCFANFSFSASLLLSETGRCLRQQPYHPDQMLACSFNSFNSMVTVPYDGYVEVVLTEGFPASMEELSAPQISLSPGVQVGLVRSFLTVLLGVWLDLQGVLSHQ